MAGRNMSTLEINPYARATGHRDGDRGDIEPRRGHRGGYTDCLRATLK